VCILLLFAIVAPEIKSIAKSQGNRLEALQDSRATAPNVVQQVVDHGDTLCATWQKDSLREAISEYEKAAVLWTSVPDFARASQAMLKAGDVHVTLSEYAEALKRYKQAQTFAQESDDWLVKARVLSHMGRLQSFIGKNDLAQQQLAQSIDLFKQHQENLSDEAANAFGEALVKLGDVSYSIGDFVRSREQLKDALAVVRNNPKVEAKAHLLNGQITGSLGDPKKAVTEINQALELYRTASDKIGEATVLTTLGLARSLDRDVSGATELHNAALGIFRAAGDRANEAVALTGLGQAYDGVNTYALAINYYDQALRLYEEIGSVDGIAVNTFIIGRAHSRNKNPDLALPFYERCLQVSRATGKVRTEATVLNEIAKLYAAQGRTELALQQYQKLMHFYQAIGDQRGQATTLNAYGDLLLRVGQKEKGLEALHTALPLSENAGDKGILVSTLYNLARANLTGGDPEVALPLIRRSLEIIEDLRANVASPDFRVSYLSGARKHYELCIQVLTELDRQHPEKGYAAEALLVSEKGRARLLLDLVNESHSRQASPNLIDRERELRGLFRVQAQYRMGLALNKKEATAIDDQMAQLQAEYQQVLGQIRQQSPRLIEPSTPLTLQQIQNELRSSDTMLLEYFLGDERSYLWAVTSDAIRAYQLPARKVIEEAALEVYSLITARQDEGYFAKATNLSQILLGPLADQLGSKRLLIVTEGALQYIPLEALPVPVVGSKALLIEKNEVVHLPSISTLIASRAMRNKTGSPSRLVAVIADPVFSSSDERVRGEAPAGGVVLAASDQTRSGSLARLTYASEEADAISAVSPWGTTFVAKGFDASRETAMSKEIGQYQIVHFATHGFLDSEHPDGSGMVLSTLDRDGKPTNGVMALPDIYNMDLSAELTVLSACQTALGKDIQGEGLVGLTHSFMSAGAKTVVASLWKVDDKATSVLMADFYESMLRKGMAPSAALRAAKLKLISDKRWSAPYYWAGFVLQGEYSNHIEVVRYPWLRPGLIGLFLLTLAVAGLLIIRRKTKNRMSLPR
jgi:CHAT domain-containing protein/Tfp pilus assembly protein PilF